MKIGDGVDQAWTLPAEQRRQPIHLHAILVHRHTDQPGAEHAEQRQGATVGGLLHHHHIPRGDEQPGHQIQALLTAADHQQTFGRDRQAACRQPAGENVEESRMATGRTVLQQAAALLGQGCMQAVAEGCHRKKLLIRHAAGKRDHAGLCAPACQALPFGILHRGGRRQGREITAGPVALHSRVGLAGDERAAADPGTGFTCRHQGGIGLLHRAAVDAQAGRQFSAGRQPFPVPQLPPAQGMTQAGHQLLVQRHAAATVEAEVNAEHGNWRIPIAILDGQWIPPTLPPNLGPAFACPEFCIEN